MVSAHDIGAKLFLVPADNCAEAVAAPQPGLTLARVATLDDALTALSDLRAGRTPAGC
jgi:PDZ domain-containing protein